jgi:hypothetical protein
MKKFSRKECKTGNEGKFFFNPMIELDKYFFYDNILRWIKISIQMAER